MTSHILAPLRSIVSMVRKAMQPAAPQPDPLMAFLDGMEVPPHVVGKHFDVVDPDGRIVATTRRQVDPRIGGMIG